MGEKLPDNPDNLNALFNLDDLCIYQKYFHVRSSQRTINELVFLIYNGILKYPADFCLTDFTSIAKLIMPNSFHGHVSK